VTPYRAARVLDHAEAAEGHGPGDSRKASGRVGGFEIDEAAAGDEAMVHGHRTARCQRHLDVAERPFFRETKEGIARVVVQYFPDFVRMPPQVVANPLQGHLLAGNTVEQETAYGPVGVTVLVGVVDAEAGAVFKADDPRSLDLQERQVHMIRHPGEHLRPLFQ